MNVFQRFAHAWKSATNSLELFRELYGRPPSRAGFSVTVSKALEHAVGRSCVELITSGLALTPFKLYRNVDGARRPATDHALYDLIVNRPNGWQNAFEFRETLAMHTVLTGNGLNWLNRVGRAREIREIITFEPQCWKIEQKDDFALDYELTRKGYQRKNLASEDVWHLRGPSWNTYLGLDATKLMRDAMGLGMALEATSADLQKNGGQPSGVYSHKGGLDDGKYKRLVGNIEKQLSEKGKPLILDNEGKWIPTVMTGVDSQHLEQRRHQIEEVCRHFNVMPLMIGHPAEMAARAAVESIFQIHLTKTMQPWYERIEASANASLLTEAERAAGYYFKFTPNALMRVAAKDRAEFYAKSLGSGGAKGWMTQNEVRALEDMDEHPDPEANELPQQINAKDDPPEDDASDEPDPDEEDDDDED